MCAYIPTVALDVLKIDTPQMIEVDRLMIEQYHIELIQMMENAGRCLAVVARERFLGQDPQGKKVAVLEDRRGLSTTNCTTNCVHRERGWQRTVHRSCLA